MRDKILKRIEDLGGELEAQKALKDNLIKNLKETDRRMDQIQACIYELYSLISDDEPI